MGLESATYINGLVESNPTSSDNANQGDNHLRLIKSTLKATFPSITGAVTVTQADLNSVTGKLDKTGGTLTGALAGTTATFSGGVTANVTGTLTGGTGVLAETGSNLFFTNARARAAISAAGDISYDPATGVISFSAAAAPVTSVAGRTGAITLSTTDVSEGVSNLYFTTARARSAISVTGDLTYNATTGVIGFTAGAAPVTSVAGRTGAVTLSTADVSENVARLYYTDARARAAISVSGAGSYNSTTGVITINAAPVTSVAGKTGAVTLATSDISGLDTALAGKASTSSLSSYLPLSGGTLSGGITISTGNLTLSSGNVSVTGTITASGDITAFSDIRVKSHVETISEAIYKVKQLRGVSYISKFNMEPRIGVIAQEVERIVPEVVHTHSDGMKSVAYQNLVGLLIEAIKDLELRLSDLENR